MNDLEYCSCVEYAMAGFPVPPEQETGSEYVWEFEALEPGGPLWRARPVDGWLWGKPIFRDRLRAHQEAMRRDVVPY